MLSKITFEKFTAFEKLEVLFSPGINVFIGENGTGKTHILKAAYAACDIAKSKESFAEKINNVFYPSGKKIGRLVKRASRSSMGAVEVSRQLRRSLRCRFQITQANPKMQSYQALRRGRKYLLKQLISP